MNGSRRGAHHIVALAICAAVTGSSPGVSAFSLPTSLPTPSAPGVKLPVPKAPAAVPQSITPAAVDLVARELLPDMLDQLGPWAFKTKLKVSTVSHNAADQQLVDRVMKRIVESAKRSRVAAVNAFQWEAKVVEGDEINAYAFPGGKIIVYDGLLRFTNRSEDHLAVVLGHEIVHALARHFAKRMREELRRDVALAFTGKQLSEQGLNPAAAAGIMAAMAVVHEGVVMRPYLREHESEADHQGLLLAARAGYDPAVAVEFWRGRKEYSKPGLLPPLFSAHPSDDVRIKQITTWMPEALAAYREAGERQARAGGAAAR